MDTSVVKDMIGVIRAEQQRRRAARLADEDWERAYEEDRPFVNELCLLLLVAVRHQVERELIRLAACVTDDGKEINPKQYQQNVQRERKLFREDRNKIIEKLKLNSFPEWESSMKTLQLLANCYKHDPSQVPNKDLLEHLKLKVAPNYAPLPESGRFQEGLAVSVNLPTNADYCDITEKLLDCAAGFLADLLADLQKKTVLSRVGPVNLGDPGFYVG